MYINWEGCKRILFLNKNTNRHTHTHAKVFMKLETIRNTLCINELSSYVFGFFNLILKMEYFSDLHVKILNFINIITVLK